MSALEGQFVGEFKILTKLGQGGMGTVYLAEQPSVSRMVAVKVLREELVHDDQFLQRFKREAMLAASNNHPGMVQVYAAGEWEGIHYIAMEYVDGESLEKRLDRELRLKPRDALSIAISLAQTLDVAWQKTHLIHRDVKPSNVLMTLDGAIKLADFGMARNVNSESSLTSTGMPIGTPHYSSPEQARSHRGLNFSTDVYSLGCTLFHMLCGRTPYVGDGSFEIMLQHVSGPPPSILKHLPGCPPAIVKLLERMLAKDPEQRHASYAELLEEMRAVHRDLEAAPTPGSPRMAIVLLTTVALGMAWWLGRLSLEKHSRPESSSHAGPAQKSHRVLVRDQKDPLQANATLPPDVQVQRVVQRLKELNPAFDPATVTYTIKNGVVATFGLSIVEITNISPIRALISLRELRLGQTGQASLLSDLQPLEGMSLTRFDCYNSQVKDLSPLRGMPLTILVVAGSRVKDLSPIGDCALQFLAINDSQLESLEPLRGMPLRSVNCGYTKIADLTPLRDSPVQDLNCCYTGVRDLTPIAALFLTRLICHHTAVADLSPITAMPLREIDCDFDGERDARILRTLPTLERINGQPAEEFWNNR